MDTQFDIQKVIDLNEIQNELDFERALIADRKLRLLSKEDPKFKSVRKNLRDLIEKYENKNWSSKSRINTNKLRESDIAEIIAEEERLFLENRKKLIQIKLKKLNLNQQEFGMVLGHKNKSYISELMNGIKPFSLKDIIVINKFLKIDLTDLVPTFLPQSEQLKIKASIEKLNNPKIKLNKTDFVLT